jgi:putative membrane protein
MKLKNTLAISSLTVAISGAATTAIAQVGEISDRNGLYSHGNNMMWGDSQWGGFGMFLGPIFMILIMVGIVAGIIYLLRQFGGLGSAGNSHLVHDRAMVLLKERYAKGEIDSSEFEERKKLLAD